MYKLDLRKANMVEFKCHSYIKIISFWCWGDGSGGAGVGVVVVGGGDEMVSRW
jgi:hypothetical protein